MSKVPNSTTSHFEESINSIEVDNCEIQVFYRKDTEACILDCKRGRYLIGTSPLAQIRISGIGEDICGILNVSSQGTTLKCISLYPAIYSDSRRLQINDQIILGDVLDVFVGRTKIRIQVKSTLINRKGVRDFSRESSRQILSRHLLDQMNESSPSLEDIERPEVRQMARLKLKKLIADLYPSSQELSEQNKIEDEVFDEVMGLGPLESLLKDDLVSEIMINHHSQIYVEKEGKLEISQLRFSSDQALLNVIERIVSRAGRRIDQSSPIVDTRLKDGSRVNAIIPPLALRGPCLTIRRFPKEPVKLSNLLSWGSFDNKILTFFKIVVESKKNILISGGTGSGKTTLLNALSRLIPSDERIVTVEDAAELQLQQLHVVSLETRLASIEGRGAVTIRDLVKNTLRMRPDRIIVGECRGGEALDMLQAMNTGHDGSMTTAHANSTLDMLRRLETMVLMAGMELPLRAVREQIASAVNIIIQTSRRKNGKRLIVEIAWIAGLDEDKGEYLIYKLFYRNSLDDICTHFENIEKYFLTENLEENIRYFSNKSAKET